MPNNKHKVRKGQKVKKGQGECWVSLANYIEQYIRELFDQASQNSIELQRRRLAQKFSCVPSQINYVLSTRFSIDRGYLVESRRGEGGYIRIQKISLPKSHLKEMAYEIGSSITRKQAKDLLDLLLRDNLLTEREYKMARIMLAEGEAGLNEEMCDLVRANLLKAILTALG